MFPQLVEAPIPLGTSLLVRNAPTAVCRCGSQCGVFLLDMMLNPHHDLMLARLLHHLFM